MLKRLWNDESGLVVTSELVMVSTVGVLGLLSGLSAVTDGVNAELQDTRNAIRSLNQSYRLPQSKSGKVTMGGSAFIDQHAAQQDTNQQPANEAEQGITLTDPNKLGQP